LHLLTHRPLRFAAAVAILAAALIAALLALPREQATATPPSGTAAELLARGTIAQAGHVRVAGIKLATAGRSTSPPCTSPSSLAGAPAGTSTRNETGGVTEAEVTFLLPVGAPTTVDVPRPTPLPGVAEPTVPGRGPTPARLWPLAFLASPAPGWQGAQSRPQRSGCWMTRRVSNEAPHPTRPDVARVVPDRSVGAT
jgi:hypothetical protein